MNVSKLMELLKPIAEKSPTAKVGHYDPVEGVVLEFVEVAGPSTESYLDSEGEEQVGRLVLLHDLYVQRDLNG